MNEQVENPAERAALEAWEALKTCLIKRESFIFEAGAGAGKTYSLIEALKFLIKNNGRQLARHRQQIACITFTNVARDTILERTDSHPVVFCETTHAFAWTLIENFQKQLRTLPPTLDSWRDKSDALSEIENLKVEYALGHRKLEDHKALLHHNDIFPLTIKMMESEKFRNTLASRFPVVLVDEYQDTNSQLIAAIKEHFFGRANSPQFGLFGDHWQKIYGDGCGAVDHEALVHVKKGANFRSARNIVDCLNRIRPDLPQMPSNPTQQGSISIFNTNAWEGVRQTKNHWQGDLPAEAAATAYEHAKAALTETEGWDFTPETTKVLMLTHRALAAEMGYPSLPKVFRFNDSFTRKSNEVIAFFDKHLEPAAEAFLQKRYGAMFAAIDARVPVMNAPSEKKTWAAAMRDICEIRDTGTVGDMIKYLRHVKLPILSEAVIRIEEELEEAEGAGAPLSSRSQELKDLHDVEYREIKELSRYLQGHSPFETKHGVKGAQFENVFAIFGRGWSDYDFNAFLEFAGNPERIGGNIEKYERYRNLFYVVCSRPQTRLALLFTQKLSRYALNTLNHWFSGCDIKDIGGLIRN